MRPRDWYERDLCKIWFVFGLIAGAALATVVCMILRAYDW